MQNVIIFAQEYDTASSHQIEAHTYTYTFSYVCMSADAMHMLSAAVRLK